jgi:hypothetical protein
MITIWPFAISGRIITQTEKASSTPNSAGKGIYDAVTTNAQARTNVTAQGKSF